MTWFGATSLAFGSSGRTLLIIGIVIAAQGSASIPLLAAGFVVALMAAPGWIELTSMFPDRVGGIAASCIEAFRPYGAALSNLAGVCYWWGWAPFCGLAAMASARALHAWYLPNVSVTALAIAIVAACTAVSLSGLRWTVRVAKPIALGAFALALCSSIVPVLAGHVEWHQAFAFHLQTPFTGMFGTLTSVMAGLFVVGFAAPAFEAAACHIGEMRNPTTDQPRALWTSAAITFVVVLLAPLVWLGVFGPSALQDQLATLLGPTFAPVLGGLAKAAAVWLLTLTMLSGTLQPLAGPSRTLAQLADDGLLPRSFGYRHPKTDAPVVAIMVTAGVAIAFLLLGSPTSMIAAACFTYLIGIALPSVAVWLLRRTEPRRTRPYRARGLSIHLGLVAAAIWLTASVLGFGQFGLPAVCLGLAMALTGSLAFLWRRRSDRRLRGESGPRRSIYLKLTGAMFSVLVILGSGYLIAVGHLTDTSPEVATGLRDLFVAAGLLTLSVGLVLPGTLSAAADQVTDAARHLARGTMATLTAAMEAMAGDDLDEAHALVTIRKVEVHTADEFGEMASSFNEVQDEAVRAALALDEAVAELRLNRSHLASLVEDRTVALIAAHEEIEHAHRRRQDMHDRMRAVSARFGGMGTDGVELDSTLEEIASTLGAVLEVDVVAIYLTDSDERIMDHPTTWRYGVGTTPDPNLRIVGTEARRFLHGVAERRGTLAITDLSLLPDPPSGAGEPAFATETGYRAWILSPVHDGDGRLLSLLTLGMVDPIVEWNEDAIALVDAVTADLGRAIIQADLYERQRELVAQLQELDRAKSEFLSTFSHELRTPLTSIRAYTELLRDDSEALDIDQDRMLEIIERNGVRLSVLIEDILTLSHLNSAVYDIDLVPVELGPLVESVCDSLLPMAQAKSLTLTSRPGDHTTEVLGDADQLERLLINLANNAIKFTPPGGRVELTVSTSASSVVISVSDTGIGIPKEEQEAVFGRFFRGAEASAEVIPGTGLGLAIVQAIVEHHGGTLTLNSAPGQGTVIRVRLPTLADARAAIDARNADESASGEVISGTPGIVPASGDHPFGGDMSFGSPGMPELAFTSPSTTSVRAQQIPSNTPESKEQHQ
jgi:signal transduction histidine kinase/amino acid transporter